jgi:hypothetical protein
MPLTLFEGIESGSRMKAPGKLTAMCAKVTPNDNVKACSPTKPASGPNQRNKASRAPIPPTVKGKADATELKKNSAVARGISM